MPPGDNSYNTVAVLNGFTFPYSPNKVDFGYTLNKVSFNTAAGRVTQVLSVKIDTITWEGDTGSRQNLLELYSLFKKTQDMQIEQENSSLLIMPVPVGTGLSASSIPLQVWARSMQVGWNYQSVTYPYRIQLEVDEGFGLITGGQSSTEIDQLVNNSIGVDVTKSIYTGLINTTNINTNLASAVDQVLARANNVDNLLNPSSSSSN